MGAAASAWCLPTAARKTRGPGTATGACAAERGTGRRSLPLRTFLGEPRVFSPPVMHEVVLVCPGVEIAHGFVRCTVSGRGSLQLRDRMVMSLDCLSQSITVPGHSSETNLHFVLGDPLSLRILLHRLRQRGPLELDTLAKSTIIGQRRRVRNITG
ncbi:unnamed protein product [Prorocentrum cordatum]|uniref:Uncharacterized protein n=1 Tax=Prorocentrum cordatum TaxID=2364126 RepID=A0ABN9WIW2_9DINO|nr:unnamed protein product [Polarella glacialis]